MRGRKRTPTELLKIRGTWRKDRHAVAPTDWRVSLPPLDLGNVSALVADNPRALEVWKESGAYLLRHGIVKSIDRSCFETYCVLVAQYEDCEAQARARAGTDSGRVYAQIAAQYHEQMLEWAGELGLTPASFKQITGR